MRNAHKSVSYDIGKLRLERETLEVKYLFGSDHFSHKMCLKPEREQQTQRYYSKEK